MNSRRLSLIACSPLLAASVLIAPDASPAQTAQDSAPGLAGNTEFALNLFSELKKTEDNLFFSPYSVSAALAMVYAGAKGTTAEQMAEVLHFNLEQEKLHSAFGELQTNLNKVQEKKAIELNIANALWLQEEYPFSKEFLEITQKHYAAGLNQVDFKKSLEKARKKINQWVEKKTRDKIKELIKPGILSNLCRLVITNAMYFKGTWEHKFRKDLTREMLFWTDPQTHVPIQMMSQKEHFAYADLENLQVLELLYRGGDLSMLVLLPKEKNGLEKLEQELNIRNLESWISAAQSREVIVYLPRFMTRSQVNLAKVLSTMGMSKAFTAQADFSGIADVENLFLSEVIHEAFVDVNEEGTEAAAATAISVEGTGMPMEMPPEFKADHPFLFLIYHRQSKSILFMGRVSDPT